MYILTLVYPDGTKFIVGGFSNQASVNDWIAKEQEKPSWKAGTTTQIDETPPPNPIPNE